MTTTRESLREDLERLGLKRGDVVLVRARASAVGRVRGGLEAGLMGALRDAVGEEGTLVSLAFTRTFVLLRLDRDYVFRPDTPTTAGAVPQRLLETPGARRSRHPTNSFVAVGPRAEELLAGHDETASCFEPMAKLLELDGKQLLIGCAEESPGFTTVHWAQHTLGLDARTILRGRVGVLYERDGVVRRFVRRDVGGCSRGFGKFYPRYEAASLLRRGPVGAAECLCVDARPAFAIERPILERDPLFALCDDPLCHFCRASWTYNVADWPGFYLRAAWRVLRRGAGAAKRDRS